MALLNDTQMEARMDVARGAPIATVHDFTAMTSAQVLAAYELSAFMPDRYVPQVDGSYVEREAGQAPVTNKGIVLDGAFTNYAPNGLLTGMVAGTPGAKPTHWSILNQSSIAAETAIFGVPAIEHTCMANTDAYSSQSIDLSGKTIYSYSCLLQEVSADVVLLLSGNGGTNYFGDGVTAPGLYKLENKNKGTNTLLSAGWSRTGEATYKAAGQQVVLNIPFCPNTLALSSASTTAKVADIVQREVDLTGPFAIEIIATTAPGDPGIAQQLLSLSRDATNRIGLARYTNTRLVRVASMVAGAATTTVGTAVANNTQTTIRLQVEFNRCRISVDGTETETITKARVDSYVLQTLGADYNGAGSFWGTIQFFKLLENYIATDDELENGFAI